MSRSPGPVALALLGADGRNWYRTARVEIVRYALSIGRCPRDVAAILAITSPRVTVARNVYCARAALEGRPYRHLGRVLRAVDEYRSTGRISGPKVVAFARALRGGPDSPSARDRRRIERGIRSVAARLGWTPAETQAAIWCGAIRHAGKRPATLVLR